VIRFDFDDRYRDESDDRELPWLARVLIADLAFYFLFAFVIGPWLLLALLFWPKEEPDKLAAVEEDETPIVFMTPPEIPRELLRERPPVSVAPPALEVTKPPERIVLPGNDRPFEAGEPPAPEPARVPETVPQPTPQPRAEPEAQIARNTTAAPLPLPRRDEPPPPVGGVLGRALKDLDRYAQTQTPTKANPYGGATDFEDGIQFDRKGVNFEPWLRRFVSQVRRNWFVPLAAQSFRGRVVLQFVIHRDGRITDLQVARPSDIEAFNRAAYDAIRGSNPTEPLPAEYPDDAAPFTVTFYYNERPGP
jgi:periplasmic protein TonB